MARLVVEAGEGTGTRFELGASTVLGRLKSCEIPVKDKKSSRTNSRIFPEAGGFVLEDLGSSNGTFLNGAKVDRATLKHGDRVSIGATVFRFESEPASAPPLPPLVAKKPAPAVAAGSEPVSPAGARPPGAQPGPGSSRRPSTAIRSVPPAPSPPVPHAPAGPVFPSIPLGAQAIAAMETPPAGILGLPRSPDAGPVLAREEEVDEIDLGGDDRGPSPGSREAPAPGLPAPTAAPMAAAPPAAKKEFVPRVALRAEHSPARRGSFAFEDVSQRSAWFQALVVLAALALIAALGYGAFRLAGSLF
jgi:predicted component of type VI protein secretion system